MMAGSPPTTSLAPAAASPCVVDLGTARHTYHLPPAALAGSGTGVAQMLLAGPNICVAPGVTVSMSFPESPARHGTPRVSRQASDSFAGVSDFAVHVRLRLPLCACSACAQRTRRAGGCAAVAVAPVLHTCLTQRCSRAPPLRPRLTQRCARAPPLLLGALHTKASQPHSACVPGLDVVVSGGRSD